MSEATCTDQLLQPAHDALEGARAALTLISVAILLVLGGAKLERWLMKRQLAVLNGGEREEVDLAEGTGGDRS